MNSFKKLGRFGRTLVGIFFVTGSLSASLFSQKQDSSVRVIPERMGVSIKTRLLPDDNIVEIRRERHGVELTGRPSVEWAIETAVRGSDLAVIMTCDTATSWLTNDESWIHTRIAGTINQVVSQNKAGLKITHVELEYDGGELMIENHIVRANPLKIREGQRYLAFLHINEKTNSGFFTNVPYLIEQDTIFNPSRLESTATVDDPLHGLSLTKALNAIRRVPKEPIRQ